MMDDSPPKDNVVLSQILSLQEMEDLAMQRLSPRALSYYTSATDDEITKRENGLAYRAILLRPRVFVDCTLCDLTTSLFSNIKLDIPIFISPSAQNALAHEDAERGVAAACSKFGALQIISKNASLPVAEIVKAGPRAVFAWQLYIVKDIEETKADLERLKGIPQVKFIVLTVDAPFPGKREREVRFKAAEVAAGRSEPQGWGTESALTWRKTLAWLQEHTDLPVVLKGVQTHEDAYAASLFPAVKAVILSNHGGRALDTAAPPVQTLLEIRRHCPQVLRHLPVLVDGGVRRGTDVVKALALGARAVGIGRAALFGLAVGGGPGVERTLEILVEETKTAMRLLGANTIADLNPRHVNTTALNVRLYDGEAGLDTVKALL